MRYSLPLLPLLLSAVISGCGATTRDGEGNAKGGSAGTLGTANTGGGVGGVEPAGKDGGAAGSASGDNAGAGGQLGVLAACQPLTWQPYCDDSCSIVYSEAFACSGTISALQTSAAAMLIGHRAEGAVASSHLFDFHLEDGLVLIDSLPPDERKRLLTHDDSERILIEETDSGLVTNAGGASFIGAGSPWEARVEDGSLYVLTRGADDVHVFQLWRRTSTGEAEPLLVYPAAESVKFVSGPPATSLLVADAAVSADEQLLWGADASIELQQAPAAAVSAFARNGTVAFLEIAPGRARLFDAGGTFREQGADWPTCSGSFVADAPYVCEDEAEPGPQLSLSGQVLGAQLVYVHDRSWLAVVTADTTFQCQIETEGGCFETLPCQCAFAPSISNVHATLQLISLDEPAATYRVDLGFLPNSSSLIRGNIGLATSGAATVADFTVALEVPDAYGTHVHYLLVRGN